MANCSRAVQYHYVDRALFCDDAIAQVECVTRMVLSEFTDRLAFVNLPDDCLPEFLGLASHGSARLRIYELGLFPKDDEPGPLSNLLRLSDIRIEL